MIVLFYGAVPSPGSSARPCVERLIKGFTERGNLILTSPQHPRIVTRGRGHIAMTEQLRDPRQRLAGVQQQRRARRPAILTDWRHQERIVSATSGGWPASCAVSSAHSVA